MKSSNYQVVHECLCHQNEKSLSVAIKEGVMKKFNPTAERRNHNVWKKFNSAFHCMFECWLVASKLLLIVSFLIFRPSRFKNNCSRHFYTIVKILNLYIILLCTHLYHFFPVSIQYLQCIHSLLHYVTEFIGNLNKQFRLL